MRAGRPEQICSCASEGFVLQIGEQLFCMIIRAPDADTAASFADRPVTSSPHGVMRRKETALYSVIQKPEFLIIGRRS
jgi:hypothetical protein